VHKTYNGRAVNRTTCELTGTKSVRSRALARGEDRGGAVKIWSDLGTAPRVRFLMPIILELGRGNHPVGRTARGAFQVREFIKSNDR
jgi:hypothetical protein